MSSAVQMPARSRAEIFVREVGHISPVVLRLGGGQDCGLQIYELERLVATDPQFALRVLSLANSAFYSQRYRVDSLRAALVVLGTDIVCRLAEGILARKLVGTHDEDRETFWLHCLAVGVAARLLAETYPYVDSEQAFIAGLLHDIGWLACDHENADPSALEVDDEHASLGAEIAQLLDIPLHLCSAIHTHHDSICLEQGGQSLEAAVFKANVFAEYCGYSHSEQTDPAATSACPNFGEFSELGFVGCDVEVLTSDLHEQVAEMTSMIENSHPGGV